MAGWDLFAKMRGRQIHQLFNKPWQNNIFTDYTIGIDDIDKMVEKLKANPWPIYKVKLGTPQDVDIIKALRAETTSAIRIDANAGWTLEQALQIIPELKS